MGGDIMGLSFLCWLLADVFSVCDEPIEEIDS
jgi:hypothetical protein